MNFILGRIATDHFPIPLHRQPTVALLEELTASVASQSGKSISCEQLASGFIKVANVQMAEAIRSISISRGEDPRNYALAAFGGAAPQHACELARQLQMERMILPFDGGILSAWGIEQADHVRTQSLPIYELLSGQLIANRQSEIHTLIESLIAAIVNEGLEPSQVLPQAWYELRYCGQEATLLIEVDAVPSTIAGQSDRIEATFHTEHERRFGYALHQQPIEVVAARVRVSGSRTVPRTAIPPQTDAFQPHSEADVYLDERWVTVPVYLDESLGSEVQLAGPCLIVQSTSTVVVGHGWTVEKLSSGELVLQDDQRPAQPGVQDAHVDPILLEVFNCRFAAIASQMGMALQKTARSVNVKERLDFSCAVFTAKGDLVANAPHVPVHLGAMSETVRNVLKEMPALKPDDVVATNDPFHGGSHLPDVTMVTPVFEAGELAFVVANRAHHAEIRRRYAGFHVAAFDPFGAGGSLDPGDTGCRRRRLLHGSRGAAIGRRGPIRVALSRTTSPISALRLQPTSRASPI